MGEGANDDPDPDLAPDLAIEVELPTELIRDDEPATVVSGDARADLPPRPTRPTRFRRVGTLGVGGMGEVHEFEDRAIGRRIALKTLRRDASPRRRLEHALEREARITGRLEHPNVVPVYDAGRDPKRGPFYTMRIVREPTLHDAIQKARAGGSESERYTLGRLLRVFVQICRAVEYAHTKGVVHCDLKPSNVLLGAFGEIFVVDWGLAHADDEPTSQWGGTPGYMAPEQVEPQPGAVGPRADVFALGAILYELLVLSPAFFRPDLDLMILRVRSGRPPYDPPRPPIERAPERVPEELSDLCERAMRFDPAERIASSGELADELELFLEGTKEKERRRARAEISTSQGESLTESYEELLSSRPSRTLEIAELRRSIPSWAGADQKSALWDAEDRNEVLESLSIRTLQAAVAAFEHALDEVSSHAPARRGLARLFRGEAQRARARGDALARVYFEGLLSQYEVEGGDAEPGIGREASLRVEVAADPATLVLERHGEHDRRLRLEAELPVLDDRSPMLGLEPGHYVLRVERAGSRPVRVPVLLRAGDEHALQVRLEGAEHVLDGEVFIAAGPALLGGHESSAHGADLVAVDVPAFVLATLPVTFAQYRAFLEALRAEDEDEAHRRLPRSDDGSAYLAWRDGAFVSTPALRALGVESESVPVFGVSALDALAYARWISSSTGRAHRLPTEDEWEKAARGVDGRRFPWGDRFDASFCKMRASRPGVPRPEPIGAFEADVSPYGVRDLAGSLACWTTPSPDGTVAARGGAWCDFGSDCHAGARRIYMATERSMRVGIRLAR